MMDVTVYLRGTFDRLREFGLTKHKEDLLVYDAADDRQNADDVIDELWSQNPNPWDVLEVDGALRRSRGVPL